MATLRRSRLALSSASLLGLLLAACSGGGGGGGSIGLLQDTDGDGIPNAVEADLGSDANDPDSPYVGGALDVDDSTGPGPDFLTDGLERYLLDNGASAPVTARTDTDFDGVPDYAEVLSGLDPLDVDEPHVDGNLDFFPESGPPLDGVTDGLENYLLRRGAAAPVGLETDSDGDGLEDVYEIRSGMDPFDATSPSFNLFYDVDLDGAPDHFEVANDFDPLNPNQPFPDGANDDDDTNGPPGDRLLDGFEGALRLLGATPPITAQTDSDGDGVPDWAEAIVGTDAFSASEPLEGGAADSDGDGLTDALEFLLRTKGASGAITAASDADGDAYDDRTEVFSGSNPLDDSEPTPFTHSDVDADGIPDFIELNQPGMDPLDGDVPMVGGGADVDDSTGPGSDPISDAFEAFLADLGTPLPVTTYTDSDADGLSNYIELLLAYDPFDADSPVPSGGLDTNATTGPAGDGVTDAFESALASLSVPIPITTSGNLDGDAIEDVIELQIGSDPANAEEPLANLASDVDQDGAPDHLELQGGSDPLDGNDPVPSGGSDSDGDRLSDGLEGALIALGALAPVGPETDTDQDGLADYLEARLPSRLDDASHPSAGGGDLDDPNGPAGDGVSDALETYLVRSGATAPVTTRSDTDADGVPDYLEARTAYDAFDAARPIANGGLDSDGDGVTDGLEAVLIELGSATPVTAASDSDGDRASDLLEVLAGTDFLDANSPAVDGFQDSDNDGVSDGLESVLISLGATTGLTARTDSDGDGVPDAFEARLGTDPFDGASPLASGGLDLDEASGPADTISDALESLLVEQGAAAPVTQLTDSDGDGAADYLEVIGGTSPSDAADPLPNGDLDPDGDRMSAALEFVLERLGATLPVDVLDDSDLDGAPDYFEALLGSHPVDADHPILSGDGAGFDVDLELGRPGDGLSDALAFLLAQGGATPPVTTANETDGDGIPDYFEVRVGADPFLASDPDPSGGADSNDATGPAGDGISDALEEVLIGLGAVGPISTATDSDGDGVPDFLEIFRGTDAFDAGSTLEPGTRPVATDVTFEGPALVRGLLHGSYVYEDDELDPEADTRARWLRDGVEIPGETLVHVVVPADFGAELTFEVTPRSAFAFPIDSGEGETVSVTVSLELAPPLHSLGGPGGIGSIEPSPLSLWLRSDVELIENEVGVPGVAHWTNRASGSSDARPVVTTLLPQRVEAAGPLGNPALVFEGLSNLQFDRPAQLDLSVFASFQSTSLETSITWRDSPAIVGLSTSEESPEIRLGTRGGNPYFGVQGTPVQEPVMVADGLPHVIAGVRNATTIRTYTDGVTNVFAGASPDPLNADAWTLGSAWRTGGFWTGELFELAVYDRVLTDLERDFVTLYLHSRQGGTPTTSLVHDHFLTHPEDFFGIASLGGEEIRSSMGPGLLRFSSPTALDEGDMLLATCDKAGDVRLLLPAPPPYRVRFERTWALTLTDGGAGDGVGLVDVGLYLGDIGLPREPSNYGLVLADNPAFFGSTILQGADAFDADNGTVEFRGVDLTGVVYLAFAMN